MATIFDFNPFLKGNCQAFIPNIDTILEDAFVRSTMFPNSNQGIYSGESFRHFGFPQRQRCPRHNCSTSKANFESSDQKETKEESKKEKTEKDQKSKEKSGENEQPSIEQFLNNFLSPFLADLGSNFEACGGMNKAKEEKKDEDKCKSRENNEEKETTENEKKSTQPMEEICNAFVVPFLSELSSKFEMSKNSSSKDEENPNPTSEETVKTTDKSEEKMPDSSTTEVNEIKTDNSALNLENPSPNESSIGVLSDVTPMEDKTNKENSSIFLISHQENPYKILIDVSKCQPKSVKVDIQENLLKISGSVRSVDSFEWSAFEKSIPSDVKSTDLTASLSGSGILTIKEQEYLQIPVIIESSPEEGPVSPSTGARSKE